MIIIVIGFCFVNPNRKAICENHSFSHFVKFRKAFLLKTFQMILRNNNQPVEKALQSLRPQAQIESDSFSPATCASEKIPLGSQTCERSECTAASRYPLKQTLNEVVFLYPQRGEGEDA